MSAIEIEQLHKSFRSKRTGSVDAIRGLDLSVPEGEVFGFLGPNGAGKTTTIRCILGLNKTDAGTVRLLGAPVPSALHTVIDRVGALVETPAILPEFSARQNLRYKACVRGLEESAVASVISRVGLDGRADEPTKGFSLGMRQRLGIGLALLGDPELLILDEPTNGLDPAGIVDIRNLLKSVAEEGRTVFVSSHNLSEIEQTAAHVAVISAGRCVAAGPVRDIVASVGAAGIRIRVEDPNAARQALRAAGIDAVVDGDADTVTVPQTASGAEANRVLAAAGISVHELVRIEPNLEEAFLELTESGTREETL